MRNLLTSRWFPLISVFLVLVAASYMLKLVSLFDLRMAKIPAIFIIVVLFSFVMVDNSRYQQRQSPCGKRIQP